MKNGNLVSIIVNNYNYARFLAGAIESALEQSYSPVEVLVVDDGSTDDSRRIIEGFGNRVKAVYKDNGGQASALNAGFEQASGEIVLFLDADDLLMPDTVEALVEVFQQNPALTRVQYKMEVIDSVGRKTGEIKPVAHIPPPAGNFRRQTIAYPFDLLWLPTSGNAFSAAYLRQVFPIPAEEYGKAGADYYVVLLAPLFGPVAFLDRPGACYRVHGSNNFEMEAAVLNLPQIRQAILWSSATYKWIRSFVNQQDGQVSPDEENYSVSSLAHRLVSFKLEPELHPLPEDRLPKLVVKGIRGAFRRDDMALPAKVLFSAWFAAVALSPRPMAAWMSEMFLFPERRQKLNRLLQVLHRKNGAQTAVRKQPSYLPGKGSGGGS